MNFKTIFVSIFLSGMLAVSALSAMQITDVAGEQITLSQEQQDAFAQCGIKNAIASYAGEHSYEGLDLPFMTAANLETVLTLIKDAKPLETIKDDAKCIELFRLANYVQAPEKVLADLADRIYKPVKLHGEQLEKELARNPDSDELKQKIADHNELRDTVHLNLSHYPDFHAFLLDCPQLLQKDLDPETSRSHTFANIGSGKTVLDLNYDLLEKRAGITKKLKSTDGIECLGECVWAQQIDSLRIEGHSIGSFDVAKFKKAFPHLKKISLMHNVIKKVTREINESDIEIDLRNNPIETLCIENPEQLENVSVLAHNLDSNMVPFKQTPISLCSTWIQAFKAKSGNFIRSFGRDFDHEAMYKFKGSGALGAAGTLVYGGLGALAKYYTSQNDTRILDARIMGAAFVGYSFGGYLTLTAFNAIDDADGMNNWLAHGNYRIKVESQGVENKNMGIAIKVCV